MIVDFFNGKIPDSFVSLKIVAQQIINEQKGKDFGYYVYSPDAYAYQQRYAMMYMFASTHTNAQEYAKKPITYIISSPHPANVPYVDHY